ncbi:UNVERIFIED_CONTAM: hypothetical protein Sradi_1769500 [Sesamum radiatum]|uniref:Reverse transcriptase domain-containing protein n=1 Tax=Sesamum radiatum TaxID=300843 RepID=A0AAW2TTU4_SESRA
MEQRGKAQWLKEGDRNTAFFHAKASERLQKKEITHLKDDRGCLAVGENQVKEVITENFSDVFRTPSPNANALSDVCDAIETRVTTAMNKSLMQPYTPEEVPNALKQMHPYKSPVPDDMSPRFYQKFWHLIGPNVVNCVLEILNHAFSGLIRIEEGTDQLHGVAISHLVPRISHLFFTDDTLIFYEATREAVNCVKHILNQFEAASGLRINAQKSAMVVSKNVNNNLKKKMAGILGVRLVTKHDKYLGLPTIIGKSKREVFAATKERV